MTGWDIACGPDKTCIARFKDPPPADMKPDESYKPEVGEWFWWRNGDRWVRREARLENTYDERGRAVGGKVWSKGYGGCYLTDGCLPATPPA